MKRMTLVLALNVALAVGAGHADAHDSNAHAVGSAGDGSPTAVEARAATGEDERARRYFTDRQVVTQHGERLRFYSDVLKDRVVLVTLFYTSCEGMCPLINQTLARFQGILGDDMGKQRASMPGMAGSSLPGKRQTSRTLPGAWGS
jgi:cytochrome oxidase Cu insertion factor (SCO1/SenC/PrrC family)